MGPPVALVDKPKPWGMKNPPYAPTAEVMPSTAALSRRAVTSASGCARPSPASRPTWWARKMTGTMRKVDPLPMPVVTNSTRNMARNTGKDQAAPVSLRANTTPSTAAIITEKFDAVTRAPPRRSASLPPRGRVSEPTSGPRKAYLMALGSANSCFMSNGSPAE